MLADEQVTMPSLSSSSLLPEEESVTISAPVQIGLARQTAKEIEKNIIVLKELAIRRKLHPDLLTGSVRKAIDTMRIQHNSRIGSDDIGKQSVRTRLVEAYAYKIWELAQVNRIRPTQVIDGSNQDFNEFLDGLQVYGVALSRESVLEIANYLDSIFTVHRIPRSKPQSKGIVPVETQNSKSNQECSCNNKPWKIATGVAGFVALLALIAKKK
jgi:hypothetical protein